jgi:arabinan endo-1,5-alpha-L-arabinosidase
MLGSLRRRGGIAVLLAGMAALVVGPALPTGAQNASGTYRNPISEDFGDTFADPAVIRGKDGFWYSYGTSDPLREGDT